MFYRRSALDSENFVEILLLSILRLQVVRVLSEHSLDTHSYHTIDMEWPTGNPFRWMAFANLSFGVLGLLFWKFRGEFWTATRRFLAYLGAAYGHIIAALMKGN
ncbi:DUF6790 family protein [Methanothermobacter sp.]|uniref:DUF6790 family protein n=1 Tax=Methanothermobacter sp. TaxID=1884223 RepID=UPI00345C1C79